MPPRVRRRNCARQVTNSNGDYWFSYCIVDASVTGARARMLFRSSYPTTVTFMFAVFYPTYMSLRQFVNSTMTTLYTNNSVSSASGTWYDVYIKAEGAHIEVWRGLMGQALSKIAETDSATVLSGPNITLDVPANVQDRYDNVRYTEVRSSQRSFVDDFSDQNYTGNPAWTVRGTWSATGYEMVNTLWSDYSVFYLSDTHSDGSIKFRYQLDNASTSTEPQLVMRFRRPGNDFMQLSFSTAQAYLMQYKGGVQTVLATNTSATSPKGTYYDVQVICDGRHIEVWRGTAGSSMQRVLSTDSAEILEGVGLNFYAWPNTVIRVDNIVMSLPDPEMVEFQYNDSNELTKTMRAGLPVYYSYDTLGRMCSKWSWNNAATQCYRYGGKPHVYTSNFAGEPSTMSWVYQADGQLHREILGTGNSGELFHWAGSRMIGETDSSGTFVRSFVQQPFWDMGGTLAEAPGSNPASASYRYFEPDEHGTPRVLRDQNKAVLAKFEYMPYGEPLSSAGVYSAMGYTGMWQSSCSGNSHFPLREYDPDIARWTTRDPLGMEDGTNMHIYVDGNPASYNDPTGGSRAPVTKPPWWSPERVKKNISCAIWGIDNSNGKVIGILQNDETLVGLVEGTVFAAVGAGTAHTVAARWMKKQAIGFWGKKAAGGIMFGTGGGAVLLVVGIAYDTCDNLNYGD